MRRTTTALLAATAALALLAGCGADTADDPSNAGATSSPSQEPTSEAPPEPEPSSEPTSEEPGDGSSDDGPPFPSDTASQTADPEGEQVLLTGIRVGSHDGYDRLVLEFSGNGTPGWSTGYVDEPVQDGSGDPVELAGDTYLDLYAAGTAFPMEGEGYYSGPQQFAPEDGGRIVDVRHVGWFEGYEQVLLGLTGDATPVRVFTLADPPRLVVDVSDGG